MGALTPTNLASRLKEQFNGEISQLVPGAAELVKLKFRRDIELGKSAVFDVQLSDELGFSVGQGDITLNGNINQSAARATVDAYSLVLQSRASYDLISRASSEKKAFAKFVDSKFIPMAESFQRRQEILHCWGRDSLGQVSGNSTGVLTLTEGSFCPTLWLGLKGAVIEAWTAKTGGSQHNGDLTISAVDVANRTVTVTGTSSSVVANDYLFFKGTQDAGHYGLMAIAKNTGTIFGISASTYELWKGNSYDVGTSALTLGKLLQAAALAANKGCNEKLKALVPISAFQSLVSDEAALRQYTAYTEKAENGFKKISFYGASGEIEVVPYHFMKAGEFLIYPERWTYILGSSEMTMALAKDGDMIFDLESTSAKELRLYSDLQIMCERPGYLVYGSRSDGKALSA
jgi:hypothetical protein